MRRSADFLHIMRSKTLYILYRARSTSVELRTRINLARAYRWCEAGHQPATVTYELRIFHRHTTVTEAAYIRSPFRLIINLKVRLFVTWRRRDVGHTFGACFFCFSLIEALFILATTMTKVPRQVDSSSAIHESIARGTIH